jgi:NAD(P)H-dependent FMN reductase
MNEPLHVAVLVGSLRAGSFSRQVAKALIARAPAGMNAELVEIGELPLYNQDLDEGTPPAAWSRFREAVGRASAILFVTPEYNRSIPGCLKNALDVGSRPAEKNVFRGLPAAVASVTPYQLGAFGANHALRQTFVFLDMPALQQPELYIGRVRDVLADDGSVKDPKTEKLFEKFMSAFARFAETNCKRASAPDFEAFMRKRQSPARGTVVEVLHREASGNLGFWTGVEHAQVAFDGAEKPLGMTLRVTEVFRFEDGDFRLVHRHAEPQAETRGER